VTLDMARRVEPRWNPGTRTVVDWIRTGDPQRPSLKQRDFLRFSAPSDFHLSLAEW
jgi:hypothetical protein